LSSIVVVATAMGMAVVATPSQIATEVGGWLMEPLKQRFALHPLDAMETYSGLIVPGGGPERLHEAARLARSYPHLRVFVASAGEPGYVHRLLRDSIEPDRIEIETLSRNTHENALYASRFIGPTPGQRWLLVTSDFHMPRAVGSFRQAGFDVTPWPVSDVPRNYPRTFQVAQHEWLGLASYWLLGRSSSLFPAPRS
jgi:uncharacterized SAM-binding protein YcdF (DUF218 family)